MKSFRNFLQEGRKGTYDLDDLNPVDYKPGSDSQSKRNSVKRKKADVEHEATEKDGPCWKKYKMIGTKKKNGKTVPNCVPESTEEPISEVLNVAQRRKRAIIARRNKAKMKRGRVRMAQRIADKKRLNNRSRRQAKSDLVKKLTKGTSKADLSPQRKAEMERRLKKMDARVTRTQKRILPNVRKRDRGL